MVVALGFVGVAGGCRDADGLAHAGLASIALLLPLGEFLVPRIHSRLFGLLYWAGVLLGLFYICLMAVLDMLATKFYYSRLQQDCRVQQARLQSELKRIQRKDSNGRGETRGPLP